MEPPPERSEFVSVGGTSATDVWAIGSFYSEGKYHGLVYHYDGKSWKNANVNWGSEYWALWPFSPTDVYMSGDPISADANEIFHFDGELWQSTNAPMSAVDLWGFPGDFRKRP
jgi:hypothetical protein